MATCVFLEHIKKDFSEQKDVILKLQRGNISEAKQETGKDIWDKEVPNARSDIVWTTKNVVIFLYFYRAF